MKWQDIKIGKYYILKKQPNYSYIKALEILKPKQGINTNNYIVVKCEHIIHKDDIFGLIKYFKPSDICKEK